MEQPDSWTRIETSDFVSLGTFRKTGVVVETPVWIARDGDDLVVTTERATGKVKRLRRNPEVTLQPCSRMGAIQEGSEKVTGRARLVQGDETADAALAAKYGFQFRAILGAERFVRRLQRREGQRVIIRIARA